MAVQKNQKSVAELVIAVMGMYPSASFHMLSVLLQDNLTRIPLRTRLFPPFSFKQFMDVFSTTQTVKGKPDVSVVKYPPSVSPLYTQFLSRCPVPTGKDTIDVTPFEFYMLRLLKCLGELRADPQCSGPSQLLHLRTAPPPETTGILAVQLFLHYITYFINVDSPTKPTITANSITPSLQRPDMFLLYAVDELWLKDEFFKDDWFFFFQQSSRQVAIVFFPRRSDL